MEIRIHRLILENFKCHRFLKLDLGGRSACIYGDNASGKTSVYDAFTWLLFGKDSAGNGSLDIKPLKENGEVRDHSAITAVEGTLTVDGEKVTLRRTCREVWTARRGGGGLRYEGNVSEYFVDGMPCRKRVFDRRIREMGTEEQFRMLTSVSFFASAMKWQARQAVLFDMAGTRTDRELMKEEPRFAPLLAGMGKLSPEAYKQKLLTEKRGLAGARDDLPARISECERLLGVWEKTTSQMLDTLEPEAAGNRLAVQVARGMREPVEKRLAKLREGEKKAAQTLCGIERQLYLLEAFTRYKARRTEGSTKGLFRLAGFRLFREQANGGLEERCDVVYHGIPYSGLNSAMRVNVGIDLIRGLNRHYGVRLPLFLDNAEGVTRLEEYEGQAIRLVVSSGDRVLRVAAEE